MRYVETPCPFDWSPVLVECPRCAKAAMARHTAERSNVVRISCDSCALVREGRLAGLGGGVLMLEEGTSGPRWWNLRTNTRDQWPTAQERVYSLWLRVDCCSGRTLWAVNAAHLDFLLSYVSAGLRERPPGLLKSWMASWRLPTWIKDAKNRDEIVTQLTRLRDARLG